MSDKKAIDSKDDLKKKADKLRDKRRKYLCALQRILETEDGILVFKDLFLYSKLFNTAYDESDKKMGFNEGLKTFGYRLLADIGSLNNPGLLTRFITKVIIKEKKDGN